MKYALNDNISYINIDIKTNKWTITEWFTKIGYMNKGYGTKAHYAALTEFGTCPIHRMSFLKKFYGTK